MTAATLALSLAACGGSAQVQSAPPDLTDATLPTFAPAPTSTTRGTVPAMRASRSRPAVTVPRRGGDAPAGDIASWQNLIIELWGPSAITAMAVVRCESDWNPNAHNRSGATGLFQILGGPFDPEANIRQAYGMWLARGWQPWKSSRGCWAA